MEVVRELDADILCLQEVDNYQHFWVKELALLGYTGCAHSVMTLFPPPLPPPTPHLSLSLARALSLFMTEC
jgi:hypothetical protein